MFLPRRRRWHPTPALLPGKSHGRRSLVGCSPWGREESDMAERLHFHFSLLCIGEGNGNPIQCSCLGNPRDGVAQSWTRLKWLSSSSSSTDLQEISSFAIMTVEVACFRWYISSCREFCHPGLFDVHMEQRSGLPLLSDQCWMSNVSKKYTCVVFSHFFFP